jgi:hypothetical protein
MQEYTTKEAIETYNINAQAGLFDNLALSVVGRLTGGSDTSGGIIRIFQ